jgi:hypothetical protein
MQRLWEKHRLQSHGLRTFKRSSDPAFAEMVEDVVGRNSWSRLPTLSTIAGLSIPDRQQQSLWVTSISVWRRA